MTEAEKMVITKYDLLYEQRMTRVETSLENLMKDVGEIKKDMRTDFRWLLAMMIALLATMAKGFGWI